VQQRRSSGLDRDRGLEHDLQVTALVSDMAELPTSMPLVESGSSRDVSLVYLIPAIENAENVRRVNAPVPLSPERFHPESCQAPVLHAGKDR